MFLGALTWYTASNTLAICTNVLRARGRVWSGRVRTACRPDGLSAWAAAGWLAKQGAMQGATRGAMQGACAPDYLEVDDALEGARPVRQAGAHPERDPPHRALGSTGHRRRRGDEAARGEGEGEGGQQRGQRGAPPHVVARGARAAERVDVLRGGGERGWASTQGRGAWLAREGRGAARRLQHGCSVALQCGAPASQGTAYSRRQRGRAPHGTAPRRRRSPSARVGARRGTW